MSHSVLVYIFRRGFQDENWTIGEISWGGYGGWTQVVAMGCCELRLILGTWTPRPHGTKILGLVRDGYRCGKCGLRWPHRMAIVVQHC
jgi:hypothetical protein